MVFFIGIIVALLILTSVLPLPLAIALLLANIFIPDPIPFIDEILQLIMVGKRIQATITE